MNEYAEYPPLTGTPQDYINVESLRNYAINCKNTNKTLETEKGGLIEQVHVLSAENDKLESYLKDSQQKSEQEKEDYYKYALIQIRELQELKKKNKDINEEASRYRSALGTTTVGWGDDDANDLIQLQKTISKLQNALEEFTTLKGKEINEDEANKLLECYKCTTVFTENSKHAKQVLSAALQRIILEMSFDSITEYLETPNLNIDRNNRLESDVNLTMKSLTNLVNHLAETRQGSDNITKTTPVKVRQQVYGVLGTRGFCKENHFFVDALSDNIIKNVSLTRPVKPNEKNQIKANTLNLIKEIIHLYFRLNAQESIPKFKDFFKSGSQIQNNLMEGKWNENDDVKNLEVDICFFPLIFVNDDNNNKILSKAKVVAKQKPKNRK